MKTTSIIPRPKMTYDSGHWGRTCPEIVAAIIYQPFGGIWRPFSVFTVDAASHFAPKAARCSVYDFDFCQRDGTLYFHNSGGGGNPYLNRLADPKKEPRCCVWYDEALVAPTSDHGIKRFLSKRTIEKWGYDILAAPLTLDFHTGEQNPFAAGEESPTEYCSKCRDWLPTETDNPCDHIWWCEKCNWWSTPSERCNHRQSKN